MVIGYDSGWLFDSHQEIWVSSLFRFLCMITYSRLDVTFYTIELIVLLFHAIFTVDPGYNE